MPTELGGYRVEDRLGVGGMGEVYRAHDESLDRAVAIKLIRPSVLRRHPSGLGKVRQRFRREARAAARLNHPAIVQIYHVLDTSHGDALVMELVEGRSLADLISEGPMEPARAAALGRRIAEGLAEAHAKGIVHRDLKPANVMIDESDRVKILDFGLAKAFETSDGRSSGSQVLTGAGFVIGSYDTMSPEQARGEAIGPASDLFSLGILLYSLLTGHRPFWGTSPMATLTQICIEPHPPISERAEGVPEGLVRLVDRLLEKEPENRPPDAATAAAELARWSEQANGAGTVDSETLVALVALDLVGREDWWEELGEGPAARLLARHDAGVAELTASHEGEAGEIEEGHLVLFSRPTRAVRFALDYQRLLEDLSADAPRILTGRVAIHFGELTLWRIESGSVDPLDDAARVEGTARAVVEGVLGLASPGQVLITRGAFDLARDAGLDSDPGGEGVRWMAHGDYLVEGADGPVSLYEVGLEGRAPLAPPDSSRAVEALTVAGRETILGWRPAAGQEVPGRDHWRLTRHLGDGGFGEVWLARHRKTGEARVFKFCFEAERLRALQREITLFRLLKEELGERDDIARILDWRLDAAPYYVESEYTEGGSLVEWTAARGDLRAVPLAERLELAAQVADALAAAHSVGVLHKDVKPGNILVSTDGRGHPRARLADFGVGAVTDRERLRRAGITLVGLTHFETSTSSAGGTRLYEAPEVLEGKTPTVQGDVYALGVVLYQLAVGDLSRALGPGWERDLDDDLLREDIASAVDVDPRRRVEPAALAERLRHLDERREERRAVAREREEADRIRSELGRTRRRRRFWATVALVALVFGVAMTWQSVLTQREARRANREAETARQVSAFLERLFADTDPWLSALGEEPTVRELIDRGTARLEDDLHDQPLVRARLLHTIGNVYIGLGAYRDAVGVLDSARQSLQLSRPNSPEMVEILLALGEASVQAGEIAVSEAALERALELAENLADEAPILRLHAYDSLGFFQIQTDRPVEAEASVERLLSAIEALPASKLPTGVEVRLRTRALVRLAHVREMEDRRDDAVVLLRRALDVIEGAGAKAGVGIDDGFNDAVIVALELAHAQVAAGHLDEGEKLLASTREVMERRLDPDRPFFAAVETVDGLLQLQRGRPDAAKQCFADALERVDNAQLSEAFAVLPLLGLGLASEARGEDDEALGYYRRLHRLAQRPDISERHPSMAEGLGRYAALLRRKGLDGEAAEVELLLAAGPEPGE